MTLYATSDDVAAGFRTLTTAEQYKCDALIEEASYIVDTYNSAAEEDAKRLVVCRMVRRTFGSDATVPMGASQGSMSGLGYSQSWTYGSGSSGELYISKTEKKILGCKPKAGFISPYDTEGES